MQTPVPTFHGQRTAGLRRRVGQLLVVVFLVALTASLLIGQFVVSDLAADLSRELAKSEALLTREKIQALVGRELAIAQRFADLTALRDWLAKEEDGSARTRFLTEAMGFGQAFADRTYFVIHHRTLAYYYADAKSRSARYRYTLDPHKTGDAWYFSIMDRPVAYTLNMNPDAALKVTSLWINIPVRNPAGMPLGLVGTGLQLDRFLQKMLLPRSKGAMCFIVDTQGRIVAHPDPDQIEYAAQGKQDPTHTLFALLASDASRQQAARVLASARRRGTDATALNVETPDGPRTLALAHLPELGWTVVSSVKPDVTTVFDSHFLRLVLAGGFVTLGLLLLSVTLGFDRIVLQPLLRLTESARRMAQGRYDMRLHSDRRDEIGELSRAFDTMAAQVQAHTEDLERRVAERTQQLESTHAELAVTHRQLTESIRYASLIQRVILPDRQLSRRMGGQYFVVWQPRDVVGGDFYLYRENASGCLFGVIDCAGHGVPGAFMTMIAHAALEKATQEDTWKNPARLLSGVDQAVRRMLPDTDRLERLATSMDIGLCFVEWDAREVHFSGAHIDLFVAGQDGIRHFRGDRGGINDRKPRTFTTRMLSLEPGSVFYLVTDGILDQSGGEKGLPFGRRGFTSWIEDHAHLPLEDQEQALARTLTGYRGAQPQRDDITVLAFRFESSPQPVSEEPHS